MESGSLKKKTDQVSVDLESHWEPLGKRAEARKGKTFEVTPWNRDLTTSAICVVFSNLIWERNTASN